MNIAIRPYRAEDNQALVELFRGTVHTVNAQHYTPAQRNAWAPAAIDAAQWCAPLQQSTTLVAETDGAIAGFGNITAACHLDRLFVHQNHQRSGVGHALLAALETAARQQGAKRLTADVSLTAQPFFARHGYATTGSETVYRTGQALERYKMEKLLLQPV